MAAFETLRPDEDVSSAWAGTTVANIDEAVVDPEVGDGSVCRALAASDNGVAQIFGFEAASGVDDDDAAQSYDHACVLTVKLYCHSVIDTAVDVAVRARVNANAAWSLYESFTVGTSYAWQECRFVVPRTPVGEVDPQVEITPSNMSGVSASFDLDVLYVVVGGISLTTADSHLTLPEDSCFEMLAEDPGVQAWMGCSTANEAGQRIYFEWNAPGEDLFFESTPFIVLSHTQAATWNKVAVGAANYLRPSGSVTIVLFDRDRFPDDIGASRIAFKNFLADTQLALVNRAGTNTDLMITSLAPEKEAERSDPEQDESLRGGLWSASYLAMWGDV